MVEPTCNILNKCKQKLIPVSAVRGNKVEKHLRLEQIENVNKWKL